MSAYAKNYGYFFNSSSGDRTYNAESFEEWLKPFFLSGVFQGELQVKAQTTPDMTVKVTAGHANLDGKAATWDTENTMQLSVASGVYDRIDTIVLRRDNVNRTISIEVVTGTASADPQPTAPTRTANTFELVLAQILVGTGVTAITQANITDTRMDSDVCGYVAATVDQIDFDLIYAEYEAWQEDTQDYFTDWFEAIRGQLDEDAAGHLQNEIDDLRADVLTKSAQELTNSQLNQVYGNLKTVSAYDLTSYVELGATASRDIPKGRYVMWYGNPAKPHYCLCWTLKNILVGDTLSATGADPNLAAVMQNSLNALRGYIDDINDHIVTKDVSSQIGSRHQAISAYSAYRTGNVVDLKISIDLTSISSGTQIATIGSGYRPKQSVVLCIGTNVANGVPNNWSMAVYADGNVKVFGTTSTIATFNICYVVA